MTFTRRLAAMGSVLALCVGNVSVCSGWQSTPEARMACCTNGTTCPMHKSESHDRSSKRVISQAQADSCCAATSTRTLSSSENRTSVAVSATAVRLSETLVVPTNLPALQEWRAFVPLPVSPVPKHLLLSVLLV